MDINEVKHGFRLLKKTFIKETDSTAYTFLHEKSGARLFALSNDDDNKVFSISFRTPPVDDTGVAHIVEHSTLCGSRKYPLKEPFVELVKGSLNTFLNAMTYPDKTMYPVASRNDKDFQNLMDVYLDAVFYPAMRDNPEVLMQEGWHYEIDDPSAPLRYSGVVYNEMKGALSAPDDLLESRIMKSLYPDTTYSRESGGDPEAIPQLTQEKFIAFHSRYYHPSNSYIYLYGDMDIEERLDYLDREYLSQFDRIPVPSHIDRQPAFQGLVRQSYEYPLAEDEDTQGKTFLAESWIVGDSQDTKKMMALEILEHALLRTPAAPLRQALIDAGLGKDVDSLFEDDVAQPFFSIIVNNSEADRAEKLREIVERELKRYVAEGLDKKLLEASLNLFEFRLREADFGSAPKGLIYGIHIMRSWLYDGEPESYLYYEDVLRELKEGLQNGYFENLLRECFLDNPHATLVTLTPSTTLAAEREQKQAAELAAKKAEMSEQEIADIIAATKALKERQQTPDSPEALQTIPVLQLSDIRRKPYDLPLEVRENSATKLLYSDIETHGITYANIYFDAKAVPQAYLPYIYLLSELIGAVDTDVHSYQELANLVNLHTGGITYDLVPITRNNEPDSCQPYFVIKAKVLTDKVPQLFSLLTEILTQSRFSDEKRITELLDQELASMELNLQRSAHQVVSSKIASYISPAGRYADEGGLPFYHFVKELRESFPLGLARMQAILARIMPRIFNANRLMVTVTAREDGYKQVTQELAGFREALSDEQFAAEEYKWNLQKLNEGLTSSSQVQYVGKGANFLKLGYKFTGTMHVLETLLRYGYLWTKVRVQGGAYGAFTNFNRNGFMFLGSYRDPNLKETLDVFDGTADFIAGYEATPREMTKAIIGTMSNIDTTMTPKMKGEAAVSCYLRNITEANRQQMRDEILGTTVEDIRALAPLVRDCMAQNVLCVFGGQKKIQENSELFGSVKPAL